MVYRFEQIRQPHERVFHREAPLGGTQRRNHGECPRHFTLITTIFSSLTTVSNATEKLVFYAARTGAANEVLHSRAKANLLPRVSGQVRCYSMVNSLARSSICANNVTISPCPKQLERYWSWCGRNTRRRNKDRGGGEKEGKEDIEDKKGKVDGEKIAKSRPLPCVEKRHFS